MRKQLIRISANNARVKYRVFSFSQKDERGVEERNIFTSILEPYSSFLFAQLSFSSPNSSLNCLSKQLLPILPDHIPKLQLFLDSLHNDRLLREHLSNWIWSSAPSSFPFRAYCCPSGEVINGFIMYVSVSPSVCCLVWIAHISSSFMPSMLTVRRDDNAVPPLDFPLAIHKTAYQNYVSQRHTEDRRRDTLILHKKEANGL